jgi:CHAT domain-containing protein/tetratricopeptide (TPR) repeat protein
MTSRIADSIFAKRHAFRPLALLFISVAVIVLSGAATTLTVPDQYPSIQRAIDAAHPGDTVYMGAGYYAETLLIEKAISLVGVGRTQVVIRPPDREDDVVLVRLLDKGDVTIQGIEVTGGERGIRVEGKPSSSVTLREFVSYDNRCGLFYDGSGALTVEQSYLCGNSEIGLHLKGTAAYVRDNEIFSCHTGILLSGEGSVELSRNLIGLCERAIIAASDDCETPTEIRSFTGTVTGQQNLLSGKEPLICPSYPGTPWPYHFFVTGYNDEIGEARAEFNKALQWLERDDPSRAENDFLSSLTTLERVSLPVLEADCCYNLGLLYQNQSLFQKANESWERARTIYATRGMKVEEANVDRQTAWMYLNLGRCEESLVLFEAARTSYSLFEEPIAVADCDAGMGWAYGLLGSYDRTIEAFERAEEAYTLYEASFSVAALKYNMGYAFHAVGSQKAALDAFEEARALYVQQRNSRAVAHSDIGIGNVYAARYRYQEALACYDRAREALAETVGENEDAAYPELNAGLVYFALRRYAEALACYQDGLTIIDRIEPTEAVTFFYPHLRWSLLFNVGLCYEEMEQLDLARSAYEASIAVIESVRESLASEALKASWQAKTLRVYEKLIDLLFRIRETDAALLYAERSRARSFLDILYQGGIGPEQLISVEAGVAAGAVNAAAIDKAVQSTSEILQSDSAVAVFEYFVTDKGVYLWVVTVEGIRDPIYVDYPRDILMQDVIEMRELLEGRYEDLSAVRKKLGEFYERLVQPALPLLLESIDTLVIIPSGPLWYLPFSALVMTDQDKVQSGQLEWRYPYLLERFILGSVPSLASVPSLMRESKHAAVQPFLALANPTLSEAQVEDLDREDYQFEQLEEACQAFAECLVGDDQEIYAKDGAKERQAYGDELGSQVIVYAAHGKFNVDVPLQSKLFLAPGGEPIEGDKRFLDGNYHAWEAILTDYHGTELVILGACETLLPALRDAKEALGAVLGEDSQHVALSQQRLEQITSGDEVVGLARAFLSSGARAVLGTLWQANPDSVYSLLVSTCEYRQQGATWAHALREAQLELMKDRDFFHPWFWAPYQLVGAWR